MESKDQDFPSYQPTCFLFPPTVVGAGVICTSHLGLLNQQLYKFMRFEEFWKRNKDNIIQDPLPKYLFELLNAKGLSRAEVIVRTGLDKAYTYQIFAGSKNPSRDKLITIAFGMNLSEDETQELLRLAGYRELWVKDERDALILFALRHGLSLVDLHMELEHYGLDPLAAPIK